MKSFFHFVKTTLIGGLFFLLPLVLVIILLEKVLDFLQNLLRPVAQILPFESVLGVRTPLILGSLLLIVAAFLCGLLAKTALGSRFVGDLERKVLSHVPGYALLKGLIFSGQELNSASGFKVGLFQDGDKWVLCFIVDQLDNGFTSVFFPDAPNPSSGSLALLPSDTIHEIQIPIREALQFLAQCGADSKKFFKGKVEFISR